MATFITPHSNNARSVSGDVYANEGQLGRGVNVVTTLPYLSTINQEDPGFEGEYFYRYFMDLTTNQGIYFKLAKIGTEVQVGYTCIVQNVSTSSVITELIIREDSGTDLTGKIPSDGIVILTAKAAGVPDTWVVSQFSAGFEANFVYVDADYGNDSTGVINRIDKAFRTLSAADSAASDTDVIYVRPGAYSTSGNLQRPLWYFAPGAIVTITGSSFFSPSFAKTFFIWGYGDLSGTGSTNICFFPGNFALEVFEARNVSGIVFNHTSPNPPGTTLRVDEFDDVDYTSRDDSIYILRVLNQSTLTFGPGTRGIIHYVANSAIVSSATSTLDVDIFWIDMNSTIRNITLSGPPVANQQRFNLHIHNLICTDSTASQEVVTVSGNNNFSLVIERCESNARVLNVTGTGRNHFQFGSVQSNAGNSDSLFHLAGSGKNHIRFNQVVAGATPRDMITVANSAPATYLNGNLLDVSAGTGSAIVTSSNPTLIAGINRIVGNTATVIDHAAGTMRLENNYISNSGGTNRVIDATGVITAELNQVTAAGDGIRLNSTTGSRVMFNRIDCTSALACLRVSGTGTNYVAGSYMENVGTTDGAITITDGTSFINVKNIRSTSGQCVDLTGGTSTSMDLYTDETLTSANTACVNVGSGGTYGTITLGGRFKNNGASFSPVEVAQAVTGSFRLIRSSLICGTSAIAGLNNSSGTTITVQIQGRACSRATFTGPLTLLGTLDVLSAFV